MIERGNPIIIREGLLVKGIAGCRVTERGLRRKSRVYPPDALPSHCIEGAINNSRGSLPPNPSLMGGSMMEVSVDPPPPPYY